MSWNESLRRNESRMNPLSTVPCTAFCLSFVEEHRKGEECLVMWATGDYNRAALPRVPIKVHVSATRAVYPKHPRELPSTVHPPLSFILYSFLPLISLRYPLKITLVFLECVVSSRSIGPRERGLAVQMWGVYFLRRVVEGKGRGGWGTMWNSSMSLS